MDSYRLDLSQLESLGSMAFSAIRSALQSWAAGQAPTLSHANQSLQPPPQGRHVKVGFVQLLSRALV